MKSVIVHGVLAVLGLFLAWSVWSGGDAERRGGGSVALVECSNARLESVVWQGEKKRVELLLSRKGEGPRGWFLERETPHKPKGDEKNGEKKNEKKNEKKKTGEKKTGEKKTGEPRVERYAAGERASSLIERLAPLYAVRSLGEVPADKLKPLGLDPAKRSLTVRCGGVTREIAVGRTTYGASTRYARNAEGGAVYLIKASLVSDLEMARARFMQRELLGFRLAEVEKAVVKAGEHSRTLLHRDRHNPAGASWVDAADPDRRNELYGNWLSRVRRLRALKYLDEGVEPGADEEPEVKAEPVVRIDFEGDARGSLELVKVPGKPARWYARSPAVGGWVTVPPTVARQVADDVHSVLGLETAPAVDGPGAVTEARAGEGSAESTPAGDAGHDEKGGFKVPKITPTMPALPRVGGLAVPPPPKPAK